ncbi:MAG: SRPBCC family protein [Gaiellaceae bacterium]
MTGDSGGLMLHLEKVLPAPTERVFAACLDPETLAEWWGPAGFTSARVDLDGREGGRYRIRMQPPDGEAFHLRGELVEVDPPRRLVYTFEWEEPDPDDRQTMVTLSFLERREGTKLVLDQGPFATEARRALHETGWTETLERLERSLT